MQINNTLFYPEPIKDAIHLILSHLDSETIFKTFQVCKAWLEVSQTICQTRALVEFPFFKKSDTSSWIKHYQDKYDGLKISKAYYFGTQFLTTLGKTIFDIDPFPHQKTGAHYTITPYNNMIRFLDKNYKKDLIMTGSYDRITIWKYAIDGVLTELFNTLQSKQITALKWVSDCNFVSGDSEGQINYWSQMGKIYVLSNITLKVHESRIAYLQPIKVSKNRLFILSGAQDGSLSVTQKSKSKFSIKDNSKASDHFSMTSIAATNYGNNIHAFTASKYGPSINIFNIDTVSGKISFLNSHQAHEAGINDIKILYKKLVTCSSDKTIKLWNYTEEGFLSQIKEIILSNIPIAFDMRAEDAVTSINENNDIEEHSLNGNAMNACSIYHPTNE